MNWEEIDNNPSKLKELTNKVKYLRSLVPFGVAKYGAGFVGSHEPLPLLPSE